MCLFLKLVGLYSFIHHIVSFFTYFFLVSLFVLFFKCLRTIIIIRLFFPIHILIILYIIIGCCDCSAKIGVLYALNTEFVCLILHFQSLIAISAFVLALGFCLLIILHYFVYITYVMWCAVCTDKMLVSPFPFYSNACQCIRIVNFCKVSGSFLYRFSCMLIRYTIQ